MQKSNQNLTVLSFSLRTKCNGLWPVVGCLVAPGGQGGLASSTGEGELGWHLPICICQKMVNTL